MSAALSRNASAGGDEREEIVVEPNLTVVRIFENISIQTAGGRILDVIFLRTVFVVARKEDAPVAVLNHQHGGLIVERPAFVKLLNDRQRDSTAFAQRHHIAVVNALDGNVMLVHVIGDLLDMEVKIARKCGDELSDGHLLVGVGEAVDVIHADGLAGGLDSVVHLFTAGGGVNHHDLILKAQNGAIGGDDAGKEDFQQGRTFFKVVILRGILHEVNDDRLLLGARTEWKEQQDKRINTRQTISSWVNSFLCNT